MVNLLLLGPFGFRLCHHYRIDVGSMLLKLEASEHHKVWFYFGRSIVFAKSPFREQANLFINLSVILAAFSNDFAFIFRYLFGDFAIYLCIDALDFPGPKINPSDIILG